VKHVHPAPLDIASVRARHPDHFRPRTRRHLAALAVALVMGGLLLQAVVMFDMTWARLFGGVAKLGTLVTLMWPPVPEDLTHGLIYLRGLAESLAMAFLGTLLAAVLAFPFALLAARNVIPNVFVHFAARRTLDGIRSIDTLIWALLWVSAVGLGPFAGILAIACSDFGIFGKLFSEALETGEKGPVEGVRSTGGSHGQAVRFGLLPQVLPVMASQVLYVFESNTRSATIIGIVGAGGIGLHLAELIRTLEWGAMAFVVGLILVAVAVIDQISSRLRFAWIGPRKAGL
jgi:phosphonate transport system permease protein